MKYEKTLVALSVLFIWLRIFFWMRLFHSTAFFIDLISKTFSDVNFMAFLFIFIIMTMAVTSVVWVLNMGRGTEYMGYKDDEDTNARIFHKSLSSDFFNSFFYTYITSMGEYYTEGFDGENAEFLWIIFLVSTFLLQIAFLNMLIAIISNTFQHVLENKQQSVMKERISMLADFKGLLRFLHIVEEFQYIFEIKP